MSTDWIPYPRFLFRKRLIKYLLRKQSFTDKTCLEIGYGSGHMLMLFAKKGFKAFGYDYSPDAYGIASKTIEKHPNLAQNITLFQKENDILKYKYDFIFAFEVLEHIENDSETLNKWKELLNVNGQIIISVPSHKNEFSEKDIAVGHYRRYDKSDLLKLFNKNDLIIEKLLAFGFPFTNITDFFEKIVIKQKKSSYNKPKDDLSKESFKNKPALLMRIISNDIILFPFYLIQFLFKNTKLGTGYIVSARKY